MPLIFKCDVCDKEFNRQWNLERHKLLHQTTESDTDRVVNREVKFVDEEEEEEEEENASDKEQKEPDDYNGFWYELGERVLDGRDSAQAINELSKLRRNLLSRYKSKVLELEGLRADPVHKKIMSTKRKLEEEDDFDSDEALEAAIDHRKFLVYKAARFYEEDFNEQDQAEEGEI